MREIEEKNVVGVGAPFISILSPGGNSASVIPGLWETFVQREPELPASTSGIYLGVCSSLPEGSTQRREDEFFYVAGMEVDRLDDVPEGMVGMTLPAGQYAVFTHKGRLDTLGETMSYIHGEWLSSSEHTYRTGAPEIELYDQRFNPQSDESEMEIWVPVE